MKRRNLVTSLLATAALACSRPLARATATIKQNPPQGDPDAWNWAQSFCEHQRHYPGIAEDPEAMLGWFANAMGAARDDQERKHEARAADLRNLHQIQGNRGNWDYDPYMHGMYNALEIAMAILEGRDPEFRSAPDQWGCDQGGKWHVTVHQGVTHADEEAAARLLQ